MAFGPKREDLRSKVGQVKNLVQLIESRIKLTGSDIDLNLTRELERIKKKSDDLAKMSILGSLINSLEAKNIEENTTNAKDILKLMLKSETPLQKSHDEQHKSIKNSTNPFVESIALEKTGEKGSKKADGIGGLDHFNQKPSLKLAEGL